MSTRLETFINIQPRSLSLMEAVKTEPRYYEKWPNRFTRMELEQHHPDVTKYLTSIKPFKDGIRATAEYVTGRWRMAYVDSIF